MSRANRSRCTVPCNHQRRRDDVLRAALEAVGARDIHLPLLDRAICWIRTAKGMQRLKWEEAVARYGLDVEVVQAVGEDVTPDTSGPEVTVYDVAAAPEQLAAFLESGFKGLLKKQHAVAGPSVTYGGAVVGTGATPKK